MKGIKHCIISLVLMQQASALTLSIDNQTTTTMRLRAFPSTFSCLAPFHHPIQPHQSLSAQCEHHDRFYALITVYPERIFPQFISFALPGSHAGAQQNPKIVGCLGTPYFCQATRDGDRITFTIRNN